VAFFKEYDICDPFNPVVLRIFGLVGSRKYTGNGINVGRRKYPKTAKFTKFTSLFNLTL
jgi:hypothetical protein